MKTPLALSVLPLVLLLGACASTRPATRAAAVEDVPATQVAQAASDAPATEAAAPAGAAPIEASQSQPTQAEQDYSQLYGAPAPQAGDAASDAPTVSYDPWEKYNRGMHRFNNGVDRFVARPLATGYTKVVPGVARRRVTNFFDNLRSPVTMVNQFLQGRPGDAWATLGRFMINTTVGIGGLFDPASHEKIPRRNEDFGQTLAIWGWRQSRYFELPFFGPRTIRDTFGLAGDIPLSPLRQVDDDTVRYGLQGLQLVDTRVQLMPLDDLRDHAPDEYALVRDGWMQRRNYQIQRDLAGRKHQDPNSGLPDYLRDEDDGTVPADAIPIPTTWGR